MDGYRVTPSVEVWMRVEAELRRRRRRRFLWWWLAGILIGIGLIRFAAWREPASTGTEQNPNKVLEAARGREPELTHDIRIGTTTQKPATRAGMATETDPGSDPDQRTGMGAGLPTQQDKPEQRNRKYYPFDFHGTKKTSVLTPPAGNSPVRDLAVHAEQMPPATIRVSVGENNDFRPPAPHAPGSSRSDTASIVRVDPGVKLENSTQNTAVLDTATSPLVMTKNVSHTLEVGSNPADSSAWIQSIGLGGGLSRIGGNINGISGIGLSYGVDLQWYRPIGKKRWGFSAGIGVQGFTTKIGGGRSADLFNTSANLTTGTSDPQTPVTGMRWLHRIDLPMKAHFTPHASRSGRPSISAGIVPGYVLQGPQLKTTAGNVPIRRLQLALTLEASASLSNRRTTGTRQFLRWQAGMTDLWKSPSVSGSKASLLEWGIRRTLR